MLRPTILSASIGLAAVLSLAPAAFSAPPAQPDNAEILRTLKELQAKVQTLETKLARYEKAGPPPAAYAPAPAKSTLLNRPLLTENITSGVRPSTELTPVPRLDSDSSLFGLGYRSNAVLSIGAYGEMKFGAHQSGSNRWEGGFDAGRIVLLPTFQITDNIVFNAEIEFEHGGIAVDDDDKLTGSVDIEQAYVDFKFNEHFNWRAPGVDVVPFGFINLFHEPTQFYSVDRPELDNGLIPTTWFEGSTSVYGKIVDNLNYQVQINTGLEDVGSKDGVPGEGDPYEAGISGLEALGLARTPIGDFNQHKNAIGFAARFSYTPPFIPGLAGSSSVFYTSNVTPRDAYADNGKALGHSSVTMLDTEVRYRMPKTGFEFRGEFVDVFLGTPANLRANNDGDPTNNVGDTMWGYSLEAAYHFDLSHKFTNGWEIVPFYRYTYEKLQTNGFRGTDFDLPNGQGTREFHTIGVALFPTPQLVLKLDYQFALDDAPSSPRADHLLGSVGFFF